MDIVAVMDEEEEGILESLRKRCTLSPEIERRLMEKLTSKQLNLLIFVIQAFYIVNIGGMYKGLIIYPKREAVMTGQKVSEEGLKLILKALGFPGIDTD
ncbi:MAG: hypothetical protein ACUVQ0_05315 [Thermoproteota archaeon]